MKYEIYQLKEDTMEQTKLRFMASDPGRTAGRHPPGKLPPGV